MYKAIIKRMYRLFRKIFKRYTKIRTGIHTYTVIEYISIFGLKILISVKDNVFFPPEHINCRCSFQKLEANILKKRKLT